jgi:hypothetical protein
MTEIDMKLKSDVADAMSKKRMELIAQPLQRIWDHLAEAAIRVVRQPLAVKQISRRISTDNRVATSYAVCDDDKITVETVDGPEVLGAGWFLVREEELVPTVPKSAVFNKEAKK